ncbi:hypothetical protein DXG03_004999 [Asterophora parasitica]|uniref:SET domain-containing protein n=1 Tax=Asterophora parasitica TaxID=117018 RepID=A0A9P7GFL7_9AGAR|nr:hypothetical protein DXG03_004999 [Asterophora parasitica]
MHSTDLNGDLLRGLSPGEQSLFSNYGIGERLQSPFASVHEAFEFHAVRHPNSIAVEDFEQRITYAELDRQANCLASLLRARGVLPGSRVCLLVERSIFMVVGIIAILKAGAAYVPLDGNIVSDSTLRHALKDSGALIVVVQRKFTERVNATPTICLEDSICHHDPSSSHCLKPEALSKASGSAYIIYTSGRRLVAYYVPDLLTTRPIMRRSSLSQLRESLARKVRTGPYVEKLSANSTLRHPGLADNWSNTVDFYNCCGPTEVTIVNTMHLHRRDKPLGIGGPIPNTTVYVLDEQMSPVKIGDAGVMWAGGACVTGGYLNLPEKTAEKYKLDPFLHDGSFMFNTGDLGRWNSDGSLEHLGRVDHQVKVKGFRVELDGVASAMEMCPGVSVAAAVLIKGELWGFFAPSTAEIEDVKAATARVQPYYAVPTHFLGLDKFPETANGKVDKRALERMAQSHSTRPAIESIASPAVLVAKSPVSVTLTKQEQSTGQLESCGSSITTATNNSTAVSLHSGEKEKIDASSLEGQTDTWAGYLEDTLPEKTQGRSLRNLRHQIFYLYRRLFGVVFLVNFGLFIAVAVKGANAAQIGKIVIANLFVAILMRQDYVVDAFFTTSPATVGVTYAILALLLGILAFAHPRVRVKFHDSFEASHRFMGWSATAFVWAQVVLLTNDYRPAEQPLGKALISSASFWLLVVLTGGNTAMFIQSLTKIPSVTPKAGSFVRLSTSPWTEWHGFATVPVPGEKGFSVICSKAGDWTADQIAHPPTRLWVRGIPTFGVMRIVPIFRRIIVVATGSGIGPCTPAILEKRIPMRLLWTAPNVRETFGDEWVDSIMAAAPDAVIYNTRKQGKPDMVKLTYRMVKEFNAEAVVIISNQKLTEKVVYGMSHEKLDALLLAQLLAQVSASDPSSQDDSSPTNILRSLIPGPQSGEFTLPIPELKPPVSLESAKYLYSRFGNNNFAIHSHLTTVGHGIFPLASRLFNHSCSPNAAAKYAFAPGTPVTMEVVALQNIPPNQEICLPYLDPALLQTRQQIFQYTYGFRCTCPSCREMELLGEIPSPPSRREDLTSVAKTLRQFVGLGHPLKDLPSRPKEAIPQSIICVFHETYLSNLSEEFSKSSHEGQYDVALDAGITLLGAYIMIYPPNYPQIGMHLLELAKTAWNMFIISGETDAEAALVSMGAPRSGTAQAMMDQVQVFLNMARNNLQVYGLEGDEDGPLQELKTLQSLLDA